MRIRRSYLIPICFLIAALSGCAARNIQRDFSFNSAPNEGLVVLSISHDLAGPWGTNAIFYMDGGVPNGGEMLTSFDEVIPGIPKRRSEFEDSYGRVLVLVLPVGAHQIDSWQIASAGLRIRPNEKPTPLKFEVTGGEIKYLGNLHANLKTGKNTFGMRITDNGYPEIRDQQQRDIRMFEEKYPQFKGKIVVNLLQLGPWVQASENTKQIDYHLPVAPIRK